MHIEVQPSNGLFVRILFRCLGLGGYPLDRAFEGLMRWFTSSPSVNRLFRNQTTRDLRAIFVELYKLFWTLANTLLFLVVASFPGPISCVCYLVIGVRLSDFLRVFLGLNFELTAGTPRQHSLSRAYFLLLLEFFEVAAMFSSAQYLVTRSFLVDKSVATAASVYYFTLRNMLTIGGGDLTPCESSGIESFAFGAIRIAQPVFSILFVTLVINQSLRFSAERNRHRPRRRITRSWA
jgi:hypothetical protein